MTTLGADSAAARRWHSLRDLPNRTSLRTKLTVGLLALVIAAVAAISISSVWILRSYLTSQDDNQLRNVYGQIVGEINSSNSAGQPITVTPGQIGFVRGTSNIWFGIQEAGVPLSAPQSGSSFGGSQAQSVPA